MQNGFCCYCEYEVQIFKNKKGEYACKACEKTELLALDDVEEYYNNFEEWAREDMDLEEDYGYDY